MLTAQEKAPARKIMPRRIKIDMNMQVQEISKSTSLVTLVSRALLICLFLVNVALVVHYIGYEYQAYFHSDAAVKNLLAREIYKNHTYFPNDWNYVNGDLWVLFGQTYIIPLLSFFKNDFRLHAFSGIVSAFLILCGTYLVAGIATRSFWLKILAVTAVAAGISGLLAENLYGQISYGYVYYFTCFIIYGAWKFIAEGTLNRNSYLWGIFVCLLFFLAFLGNPQRAAASFALPVLGAIVIAALAGKQRNTAPGQDGHAILMPWRNHAFLIAAIAIGAVGGSAFHMRVIAHVNDIRGAAYAVWLSYPKMVENFGFVISQILSIFGALPQSGEMVFNGSGVYDALRLFAGVALMALIPVALFKGIRDSDSETAFFYTSISLLISIFIFLQITTSVPDMRDPVQTARYLVPGLVLCLIAVVVQAFQFKAIFLRIVSIAVIAILATSGYRALLGSGLSNSISFDAAGQEIAHRRSLIDFLKKNDLRYGYANYWNSGLYSVLSGEDTLIRQVSFEGGIPQPMRHLSSDAWYRADAWTGTTFLLMTEQESSQLKLNAIARYDLKPSKVLEFQTPRGIINSPENSADSLSASPVEKWIIYVFDRNIAENLPGWDLTYARPSQFIVGPTTPHAIGSYSADSTPGELSATAEEKGFLYFGPYIKVPAGHYTVEFNLSMKNAAGGTDTPVTLDVVSDRGRTVHASAKPARQGGLRYELPFQLESKVADLEFRVLSAGGVELKIYSTKISKSSTKSDTEK
jgi:hypothetical protein